MKKGFLLTAIGAVCWAFSGACGQFLFDNKNVDENWLIVIRMFSASILIISLNFIKLKKDSFKIFKNKKDIIDLLAFSFLGIALCQSTYLKAISNSNAATATVIQYLGPVFIIIYVCIKYMKLPKFQEILAILFSLYGTFLLATGGDINTLKISKYGLILALLSAFGLAFYTLIPINIIRKYGIMTCLGYGMFFGSILCTILLNPFKNTPNIDLEVILGLFFIIMLGTVIAFYTYLKGVEIIGPVNASLVSCLEPVAATIFSAILGTEFILTDILGILLIIFTIAILGMTNSEPEKNKALQN